MRQSPHRPQYRGSFYSATPREKLLSIRDGDMGCFVTAADLNRRQQVDGLNPDAGHRILSQASIPAKL
jgi:hypothetical protein